ncbi:MAG: T9SS type A sorting domain-containing protein [Bacteroidales bacterium]|nr:T9SS type A sorting domain-containing protein [Bacteroidales bacterium]
MKKIIILSAVVLLSNLLLCQTYDYLDRNMIKATVNSDGTLFNHFDGNYIAGFEIPQGLGINTLFNGVFWFGGYDNNGNLRVCAPRYNLQEPEQYFGPVADDYNLLSFKDRYNRVWKVSLSEIQQHIENFNNPGYEMPESFLNWPAHGDVQNGEAADLAPYYDFNTNGRYDPENGDFPVIRGDQAVYFIFNDEKGHNSTGGLKTSVEVHGMLYCFNPSFGSVLTQTVFLNLKLFNRSTNNYSDFYGGIAVDFDLGYYLDDAFGTDSINQMMYVYNRFDKDGMYMDSLSNDLSYGAPSPAQGVVMLNKEVFAALPVFHYGSAIEMWTYPDQAIYNMFLGKTDNGMPLDSVYPGIIPTTYMHNGYPETGTGWIPDISDTSGYSFNHMSVISAGPYSLKAGETLCFDIAFPWAKDYNGTNLTSLGLLRDKANALISYFDDYGYTCEHQSLGIDQLNNNLFSIFPNPSNGLINIGFLSEFSGTATIEVYSTDGKIMQKFETAQPENVINIDNPGLYLIVVKYGNKQLIKRVSVL